MQGKSKGQNTHNSNAIPIALTLEAEVTFAMHILTTSTIIVSTVAQLIIRSVMITLCGLSPVPA